MHPHAGVRWWSEVGDYSKRKILARCRECGAVRVAIRTRSGELQVPGGAGCSKCEGRMRAIDAETVDERDDGKR